ncbi:Relaxase/mobilization nuclease domain protein [human gut metagenome]|uniref:Relaxase/mobilization nuclease domain protein n=1 Tax=human gut metagenome TaxID=408170 RepID=K1SDU2_9ZZZZ
MGESRPHGQPGRRIWIGRFAGSSLREESTYPAKENVTQAEPPKVNLLVDIQAKLQAGKGAGYTRWAKVFNLKQMAQTMNYLSENNLLEYAVLEEKAAAATAHQ